MVPDNDFDAVIIGAGFNGLYQLYRLRQEGYRVRLIDAEAGPGGVWQSNCYPGARVDSHVPNYEFSIEAVWRDWVWTERFPARDELIRYFEHIDKVLDLSRDIDFNTRLEAASFDSASNKWSLSANGGSATYSSQYMILATGFGSKPYIPDLPGIELFGNDCHHTARWPKQGMPLDNKRVGVIGTGASGVQVIQHAAQVADQVVVFQRTPVTAIPMSQQSLSKAAQDTAKADYPEMFRRRNAPPGSFADIERLNISALDVSELERNRVYDQAWDKGGFHFWVGTFKDVLTNEEANRTAYVYWRDRVRAIIDDPKSAELLAPTEPPYPFGTKRPSLEQGYYQCFNQQNVDLIDIRADPITLISPNKVATANASFDLDILVLATGFDANTGGLVAIDIQGRDGLSLADAWSGGVSTQLGMAIAGFPNMLILYGPQSSASFCNGPVCAEIQGEWLVDLLAHMTTNAYATVESTPTADQAWTAHLDDVANSSLFGQTDSWYMGANIPHKPRQLLNYPNSDAYLDRLQRCAANGYDGFVFT